MPRPAQSSSWIYKLYIYYMNCIRYYVNANCKLWLCCSVLFMRRLSVLVGGSLLCGSSWGFFHLPPVNVLSVLWLCHINIALTQSGYQKWYNFWQYLYRTCFSFFLGGGHFNTDHNDHNHNNHNHYISGTHQQFLLDINLQNNTLPMLISVICFIL